MSGVVVPSPERASNANADAERFVRSIKEECLDRIIPIGEWHGAVRFGSILVADRKGCADRRGYRSRIASTQSSTTATRVPSPEYDVLMRKRLPFAEGM